MVQTLKTIDGEGVTFDSWADYAYNYRGVLEQSVMRGNGSSGFEYFSNTNTAANEQSKEYVSQVTSYENLRDPSLCERLRRAAVSRQLRQSTLRLQVAPHRPVVSIQSSITRALTTRRLRSARTPIATLVLLLLARCR
jgi:hypothetical protein